MHRHITPAIAGLSLFGLPVAGQSSFSWLAPQNGDWTNAANWDPFGVPSILDNATIGFASPLVLNVPSNAAIGSLDVQNPDIVININAGRFFDIGSSLAGSPQIVVNSTAASIATNLRLGPNAELADGVVLLNAPVGGPLDAANIGNLDDAQPGRIGAGAMVAGRGQLRGPSINDGLILADGPQALLANSKMIDQTGGGEIVASNGGTVRLQDFIMGGTVDSGARTGGRVETVAGRVTLFEGTNVLDDIEVVRASWLRYTDGVDNNDATITVNSEGVPGATFFQLGPNEVLSGGTVVLNAPVGEPLDGANFGNLDDAQPGRIGTGVTVTGRGQLLGPKINDGLILADGPDALLTNNSNIDQSSGGAIVASNAGEIQPQQTITGGTVDSGARTGGRIKTVAGRVTLPDGSTVVDDIEVVRASWLQYTNGVNNNNATITVNSEGTPGATFFQLGPNEVLSGGTVVLNAPVGEPLDGANFGNLDDGQPGRIGADASVTGRGQLLGPQINDGLILADGSGAYLSCNGDINQSGGGAIAAANGGSVRLQNVITGGTVDSGARSGGRIDLVPNRVTTLNGATVLDDLEIVPRARLRYENGVDNTNAKITVNTTGDPVGTYFDLGANEVLTGGTVVLNAHEGSLETAAIVALDSGQIPTIGAPATVTGNGLFLGIVDVDGVLAPGSPVGEITYTKQLTLGETAEVRIEIEGNAEDQADRISCDGGACGARAISLSGTLRVTPINGFEPQAPSSWTVIESGSIIGEFDTEIYEGIVPPGVFARVLYTNTEVIFALTDCAADLAAPVGILDLADINAFVEFFLAQDERADVSAPFGVWDLSDISAFVTTFQSNCGQDP